ncbi:MAG: hypothetical protein Q4C41_09860 [Eggerthellaceae bacterium]|nr:hypothetical protein [Eggerthellaceae bacterium]
MTNRGFYFDAESCIACHTCQVACKNAHNLPVGTNYRIVRSFCTGEGFAPRWYNVSLAKNGCDTCATLRAEGEEPACVAACPQHALEFGDVEDLRRAHAGEPLADECAAVSADEFALPTVMRVKDCMGDPDFDEFIV